MRDIFFFESMLTPKIITVIYWLMLLAAIFGGFGSMFTGYGGLSFTSFITGIFVIVGGSIGARVWCELLIVLFKINENIKSIADKQQ